MASLTGHCVVTSSVDAARKFVDDDRREFEAFLESAVMAVALSVAGLRRNVDACLRFQDEWARLMPELEGAWV